MSVAAVVLGSLAAPPDPELDALLGTAGAAQVRDALVARARRWAAAVAPDIAFEANTAGAAAAALHDHGGPVLLASWDVPGLSERLAAAALADLRAGAFVTFAPATDGRPFLLGLPSMDEEVVALLDTSPEQVMAYASRHEGGMGMLPHERRLVSAGDARALAADPLAPAELVELLAEALPVRRSTTRPPRTERG